MRHRDFLLLTMVSLIWAANTIISKLAFEAGAPPLFYSAVRSLLIALALLPWLFPLPVHFWRMVIAGLFMGSASFGLTFAALALANPSGVAIVQQLNVPVTTLLSVLILGEVIRWRRAAGICMAFAGAILVMWHPTQAKFDPGLLLAAASALTASLGAIMLKQIRDVRPLQIQAWVGASGILPLFLISLLIETNQIEQVQMAGWTFVGAVLFSAFFVSIISHSIFYWILQRYDASLVASILLMAPLFTVILGVLITGDAFDLRTAVGSLLAITGVLILIRRSKPQDFRLNP